jgi:hypothetical protein
MSPSGLFDESLLLTPQRAVQDAAKLRLQINGVSRREQKFSFCDTALCCPHPLSSAHEHVCLLPAFQLECFCCSCCFFHSKVNWMKTFFVWKYESKSDSSL